MHAEMWLLTLPGQHHAAAAAVAQLLSSRRQDQHPHTKHTLLNVTSIILTSVYHVTHHPGPSILSRRYLPARSDTAADLNSLNVCNARFCVATICDSYTATAKRLETYGGLLGKS
jgi:hypothetical protein